MADVLVNVKNALGITGETMDNTLNEYINEVKLYMISAGIPTDVINSSASAGVITRGVSDLWLNGGNLSNYFYQRVTQLSYQVEEVGENA